MVEGRYTLIDLALFVRVLPLARRAQRVRTVPIPTVVADMARRGGGLAGHEVERLSLAVDRATGRWTSWFGGMNTCLVRSLVLGGLLADRGEVVLNVGFLAGDDPAPPFTGHAWVTLDGHPVGRDGILAETRYTRVLEVPYAVSPRPDP